MLMAAAAQAAPTYRLTVLERPAGSIGVYGRYINDHGVIAGDVYLASGTSISDSRAFRWTASAGYEIATSPDPRIRTQAVNIDAAGGVQGGRFRWDPPYRIVDWDAAGSVHHLGRGSPVSGNALGDIVGRNAGGPVRVWTRDGRTIGPGAKFSRYDFLALNDLRVIVGVASRPGGGSPQGGETTLWSEQGGMRYLGPPPGHPQMSTAPAAITNGGVVVGNAFDYANGGLNEAYRWTEAGGFEFLGQIAECSGHGAAAVNEHGTIVGSSVSIAQGHGCGWVWTREGGIQLLHDLVDPADPQRDKYLLQFPSAINERGEIVGRGRGPRSDITFVLTPISAAR